MRFYVGLHNVHHAGQFERSMISVKRLIGRKSDIPAREWIMDSGAFTEITQHGTHRMSVPEYAVRIKRWWRCGMLVAAVAQDWMCEPFVLKITGLSVEEHQRLTIERYVALKQAVPHMVHVMPVLQGYDPSEYVAHLKQYGDLLREGMWVGVGSVCKRNARVESVERVLRPLKRLRPDLKFHGFGIKTTALKSSIVRECLFSADSMAWSRAGRYTGDAHSPELAHTFVDKIRDQKIQDREYQPSFFEVEE